MTKIKIMTPKKQVTQIDDIPLGQVFTGSINGQSAWLLVEMVVDYPVIISLTSDGTYGNYWDHPPIENYATIEFVID